MSQFCKYHFVLTTEDASVFLYAGRSVTTYVPDYRHDFVIRTDYVKPDWVDGAVFYQIFPERFCNGDPSNDVKDGEYEYFGHPCIRCLTEHGASSVEEPMGYAFEEILRGKDKIPYLKELGVTAIYLNPIFTAILNSQV